MPELVGSWLDSVDLAKWFAGETLVQSAIRIPSPFACAAKDHDSASCTSVRLGNRDLTAHWPRIRKQIGCIDKVLLEGGAAAAESCWRETLAQIGEQASADESIVCEWILREDRFPRPEFEEVTRLTVPSVVDMSDTDAAIYLVATGKLDRTIPMRIARALLDPEFCVPASLQDLGKLDSAESLAIPGLEVNSGHDLVLAANVNREHASELILSKGWRSLTDPVFDGYEMEGRWNRPLESRCLRWPVDHDGDRLIRLMASSGSQSDCGPAQPTYALPVVDLVELVPDIAKLLDAVGSDPRRMLQASERIRCWEALGLTASPVARRIVEGILLKFAPWPYPFIKRSGDAGVPRKDCRKHVVVAFDRLRSSRVAGESPDLVAHFLGLIDQGKAPLDAWPEAPAGVWGFKIRTGDHAFLKGTIWMQPDVEDDVSAVMNFGPERHDLIRRDSILISCGALRCHLRRMD